MSSTPIASAHTEKSSSFLKGFISMLQRATIPTKAKEDISADYWNKWAFVAWERAMAENDTDVRDKWLQAADRCLSNIDRPSWTPAQLTAARIRIAQGRYDEARSLIGLILGVEIPPPNTPVPVSSAVPDVAEDISGAIVKMAIDRNPKRIAQAIQSLYGPIPQTTVQSIAQSLAGKVDLDLLVEITKALSAN
jgi:hypothetical protein